MSSHAIDFSPYLQFLCQRHQPERQFYIETLVTLAAPMVDQQAPREEATASRPAAERLPPVPVLAGLRQYALGEQQEHVLLAGRPGLGKSTALKQLLLELAEVALTDETQPIPVLVQLKGDRSILDLMIAEFRRARLKVTAEQIDDWLLTDKLVLLLDGINETPDKWRGKLQEFRDDNRTTPMIFTTRDLAIGGDLGITKRLEMRPLTKPQMREFVQSYLDHRGLPEHVDRLLGQLKDDLREVVETPLLLEMLCDVYSDSRLLQKGVDLKSKGELFRLFDREYQHIKQNIQAVPVSEHFWEFKSEVLQQLAFVMMQADAQKSTEAWFTLPKDQAERFLEKWLTGRGLADAPTKAKLWLKDLLSHHLLQVAADPEKIEFHHQLFQEYYAAKALLAMLEDKHPDVMDDQYLQHFYLNYLKWTEPLAMMLALLEDETQALRAVQLALAVDLLLGAQLAGEVRSDFQQKTIGAINQLIEEKQLSKWLKVELWGQIRVEVVMPGLLKAIEDDDEEIRERAANALGNIGSEAAISALLQAIEDDNWGVCTNAVKAIGKISSESVLLDLIEHSNPIVRKTATDMLGLVGSDLAIPALLKAIEDLDWCVRRSAVEALGQIGSDIAIPALLKAIEDSHFLVQWSAASALGRIGSDIAIPGLLIALKHLDSGVNSSAAGALQKIGSDASITALRQAKQGSYHNCVMVNALSKDALGDICHTLGNLDNPGTIRYSEESISNLRQVIKDCDPEMRLSAVNRLADHDPILTMPLLCEAIKDPSLDVRLSAINTLDTIVSDVAIPGLLQALKDTNSVVRWKVARALGNFKGDRAAHILPNLLTLIPTPSGEAAFLALTAIQSNCQFYNYEVAKWELAPHSSQPMTPAPAINSYTIGSVGILNTGSVTTRHQIGSSHHDPKA
jgi:HEAT repeat protein